MLNKIRVKFVIVTMVLLTVVVSVVLFMNSFYRSYMFRQDVTEYLEFISRDNASAMSDVRAPEDTYTAEIFTAEIDSRGNITAIADADGELKDDEELLTAAFQISKKIKPVGRYGSYVYVISESGEGRTLHFADIHSKKKPVKEILAMTAFFVSVAMILLWVSYFLSKFVTDPAVKTLEREKQFISDASHELKTPIAAIILNAQAMNGGENDSRHLENIKSEAERMNHLVKKLLTLACIDEADGYPEKKKFSLSECCEEMILPFESVAFEHGIDFSYDIEENLNYNGVCEDIKQVISILLDNAFKYTPEKGEVKARLCRRNYCTMFTVYNTGDGIAEDALPFLFNRFYRYEQSRSGKSDSFGLGLSIAKAIMTAHGGDIDVKSEYGKSAEFTVYF